MVEGVIEIKHFLLVAAIERTGSISGAARELGYSQPAASQQLRQLERILRTPVVLRVGRSSRLTQAGEVLLLHGAQAIAAAKRALAEVGLIAGLQGGELTLAAFPSAAATVVPPALAMFAKRHPDVAVRLIESKAHSAIEQLTSGTADIAIVGHYYTRGTPPPQQPGDWVWRTIVDERVHVALPSHHSLAEVATVNLVDLMDERWIAGCEECRQGLLDAATEAGFAPQISFETDDYIALQKLSAAGLGVALIPQLMVSAARVASNLVLRPITPIRMRRINAVVPPATLRIPGVLNLLECLVEAGATMQAEIDQT